MNVRLIIVLLYITMVIMVIGIVTMNIISKLFIAFLENLFVVVVIISHFSFCSCVVLER